MNKTKLISKIDRRFLLGVAHRGLHNDKFTENGMKAFENAIKNDLAFEFDVHLSKDGHLIVCHDENLVRTTGKEGIIEDLSLREIKDNYKLLDGGEIPTLQEVLKFNSERVPLVIEMKTFRRNNKAIANALKNELKEIKDKSKIMIIAFDPRALLYFGKQGYIRSLLVAKSDYYTYPFRIFNESIDIEQVCLEDKKVKRYHKKHFVNTWTIETKEEFDKAYPNVDIVTFQYLDFNYVRERLKEKNL